MKLRILIAVAALTLAACDEQSGGGFGPPGPSGPIEVGVIALATTDVPRSADLAGRVVPSATAEVRPQVDGIVRDIAFRETRRVEAGDVLYRLDNRRFQAAVTAAAAALKKAEAAMAAAQLVYDRNEQLAASQSISASTLDEARSALLQAQADQEAAVAALETAQINLDNTTITAPIGGIVGVSEVSVGALVTANQADPLVTIRQIDPIYVDLVDSSANLLRIRDLVEAGLLGRPGADTAPTVVATLENGKEYTQPGQLKLADIVVRETTGTFAIRATFPNLNSILLPGMFVRAKVDLGSTPNAFLVPQRAVSRESSGEAVVYVVAAGNTAERRVVTTIGTVGNDWIVIDGVAEGEALIVDGFQKISDGSEVVPVAATIDADGVVRQNIAPQDASEGGAETPESGGTP